MSYMRDPDRATRGVRAIASADNSPGRRALQLRRARATRARDRAMASIARGALGLVAMDPGAAGAGVATGTPSGTYKIGFTPGATYTSVTTSTDITPQPPPAYTVSNVGPAPRPQPVDPGTLLPPPTPAPPSSSTDAGGGGGGGASNVGVAMGPAPISLPIPPIPTLDTGEPAMVAPSSDNTMRNVLIAGGAALAAYFLFFRKRSSS
jgi:hypothetical protein